MERAEDRRTISAQAPPRESVDRKPPPTLRRASAGPDEPRPRLVVLGLGLAAIAIVLRLASDWVFPAGGPLWYELTQWLLLVTAVFALGSRKHLAFVAGGDTRASIRAGLRFVPYLIVVAICLLILRHGELHWPGAAALALVIANNLFFPAVEELEFRGFFLGCLVARSVPAMYAVWLVAFVHLLAHLHWFREGNVPMLVLSLALFVLYGRIAVRTKSVVGSYVAHAAVNTIGFTALSLIGAPLR